MQTKRYSVGIYARLSVDSHDSKNESIETQLQIAEEYLEKQPDMERYDSYCDLGKSGTDFERPALKRLLQDIRLKRVNCVIVKDFSRFGRDYIKTGEYIQKVFPSLNVRFISVADGFDSVFGEKDTLGMHLKNLSNEMYAKDVGIKVKSVKKARKEAGDYTGGAPPYGFLIKKEAGKRCLIAEEQTMKVVQKIHELFKEGQNARKIAEYLYRNQIHRPTEYKKHGHVYREGEEMLYQWSRETVRAVLTNPVYGGENYSKAKNARAYKKTTPKMQEKLQNGMIYCGECGRKLQRSGAGYLCRNASRIDTLRCERKYITERELEELVCSCLKQKFASDAMQLSVLLKKQRVYTETKCRELQKLQKKLLAEIDWEDRKESGYYQEYRTGHLSEEAFLIRKEETERSKKALQFQLKKAYEAEKQTELQLMERERTLRELFSSEGEGLPDGEVVELLLEKIYVYPGKRVEIVCR